MLRFCLAFLVCVAPQVSPAQTAEPKRILDKETIQKLDGSLRKHCDAHFPANVQEMSKTSCYLGLVLHQEHGTAKADTECDQLTEPRTRFERACHLGVRIATDVSEGRDTFTARLALCQAHYPINAEADAYLQESCWIGVTLAFDSRGEPLKTPRLSVCEKFSSERAFLAPCGVGLSLASQAPSPSTSPDEHSKLCAQYFDQRQLHQGYRGCLNARALALEWNQKAGSLARSCAKLTSGKHDDVERAACVIGGNIWQNMVRVPGGRNTRFQHCGTGRVSWTERDLLACLTAASILDLADTRAARQACKEIFGGRRNSRRDHCYRAVETLASRGRPPAITPTVASGLPKLPPLKTDTGDEPDLWPEAPDTPEEEAEANNAPAEEGAVNATEGQPPSGKSNLEDASEVSRIPGSDVQ